VRAALAVALICAAGAQPARAAQTFSNSAAIVISDSPGGVAAAATPYPSEIAVSGVSGTVKAVTATLHGFHHKCPQDVDVLLVGPQGDSTLLMSDAGDCTEDPLRAPVDLTFDDSAASPVPCSDASDMAGGTYQPFNWPDHDCTTENPDFPDSFPDPAPAGPWPSSLAGFAGKNPNGSWSLYVVDDQSGDDGAIDGGWSLAITTSSLSPTVPQAPGTPVLSNKTRLTQSVLKSHGVLISITSSSAGTLALSGTVSVPGAAKTYRFKSVRKRVAAGPVRVKLELPRSGLVAIKRALSHHSKLSAKITLGLTTADHETVARKLTVRLR
jgi:hypothetical protein